MTHWGGTHRYVHIDDTGGHPGRGVWVMPDDVYQSEPVNRATPSSRIPLATTTGPGAPAVALPRLFGVAVYSSRGAGPWERSADRTTHRNGARGVRAALAGASTHGAQSICDAELSTADNGVPR